jgi:hypothetical protein
MAILRLMQIAGQKADIFVCLLTVGVALLVLFFGRRLGTGLRSHPALLLIGLFAVSAIWLGVTVYWQHLTHAIQPGMTREQYQQLLATSAQLFNGNRMALIVVQIWWIACLWIDEPGSAPGEPAEVAADLEPAPALPSLSDEATSGQAEE